MAILALMCGSAIAASPEAEIRLVLNDQAAAWNRGDLVAFASGYLDSPDILFVGKTIAQGHDQMLAHYREKYPSKSQMGHLQFTIRKVQMLDAQYANIVGQFHLTRTKADGGDSSGVFTLLFQKTAHGWKIIQDHTS